MKRKLSIIILLFTAITLRAETRDRMLALLRGSWEFRTFDERSILEFVSDREVLVDNNPSTYMASGENIAIGRESDTLFARIANNRLVVTYPDGELIYTQSGPGPNERVLEGDFLVGGETGPRATLTFDGDRRFSLASDDSQETAGLYRIDGDNVTLVFDDGSTDGAWLRRMADNAIEGLVYHERLYERPILSKDQPAWQEPSPVTASPAPILLPAQPVCPPAAPVTVIPAPLGGTNPPAPEKPEGRRKFGDERSTSAPAVEGQRVERRSLGARR